jgi:hypothetical protein
MVHRDGEVMSKSRGNTIAPDEVIARYGADTLRLYILFAAPPEMAMEWSESGIEGPHRFLQRVWRLLDRHAEALAGEIRKPMPAELPEPARQLRRRVHQTISGTEAWRTAHLNTAVVALMELVNEIYRLEDEVAGGRGALQEALETLVLLLAHSPPHLRGARARLGRRPYVVDRAGRRRTPGWLVRPRAGGAGERKVRGHVRGGPPTRRRSCVWRWGAPRQEHLAAGDRQARRGGRPGEPDGAVRPAALAYTVGSLACGYALVGRARHDRSRDGHLFGPTGRHSIECRDRGSGAALRRDQQATDVDALVDGELLTYRSQAVGSPATRVRTPRRAATCDRPVKYAKTGPRTIWANDSFSVRTWDVGDAGSFFDREEQAIDRLAASSPATWWPP